MVSILQQISVPIITSLIILGLRQPRFAEAVIILLSLGLIIIHLGLIFHDAVERTKMILDGYDNLFYIMYGALAVLFVFCRIADKYNRPKE